MLIQVETAMGTSRMVCPWELVRLRAGHGESYSEAAPARTIREP
ncbi:hypothetical protein [Mycobacterium talmoniae]|nr:hypothetical protein [Mycobacterium talmoniae]